MLNDAHISLTGYVATQPVMKEVSTGTTNLTMRVAWTPRRLDRTTGEWVDGNTSYLTVICWRRLAGNVATCLRKGDPVVVKGRLSVRNYDDKDGVARIAVEVEASSIGHDLSRGVAQFQRVRPQTGLTAAEHAASLVAGGRADGAAIGTGTLGGPSGPFAGGVVGSQSAGELDDDLFDEAAAGELAGADNRAAVPF